VFRTLRNRIGLIGTPIFGVLVLAGCAPTIVVPEGLPPSADAPVGEGTAVGSILISVPTGVTDAKQKEMIESLERGSFRATVRRFVVHDLGITEWTQYVGRTFQVRFEAGAEKPLVVRGPAGTYSFLSITDMVPGFFGGKTEGCTMTNVADFRVLEGKTTYIGRLTITATFMADKDARWIHAMDNSRGMAVIGMPERFLDMNIGVTDVKDETLRALDNATSAISDVETHLMGGMGRKADWGYTPPPAPTPPPPARHK
jgi:hypothetical protein